MKVLIILSTLVMSFHAQARSSYLSSFKKTYPNSKTASAGCAICHNSDESLNSYGQDYETNDSSFKAIEALDSDVDGFSNIVEINAGTRPGDSDSKPSGTPTPTPTPTPGPTPTPTPAPTPAPIV